VLEGELRERIRTIIRQVMGDALALDLITPEAGAIYVMDRGLLGPRPRSRR
jgi:hypothetical protein